MKTVVVKTKSDVYVLCERKSLFLIQNSIILRPFIAVVAQITIFCVGEYPCFDVSDVLPPPSG